MKIGKVEKYITERIAEEGCIHITLVDPEKQKPEESAEKARFAEESKSAAVMVGGSTLYSQSYLDEHVKAIKENINIPVILFPNNVNAISRYADAIWFISLLNSVEWYYVIGAQAQGALLVREYGLEAIPMGYIVMGGGTAVASMGRALAIPKKRGEVAATYALAAMYMGMRFVYLEAGSGAKKPIPPSTIRVVARVVDIPVVVGGGIRTPEDAQTIAKSGASIVVTGTVMEKERHILPKIVKAVNSARKKI